MDGPTVVSLWPRLEPFAMDPEFNQRVLDAINGKTEAPAGQWRAGPAVTFGWDRPLTLSDRRDQQRELERFDRALVRTMVYPYEEFKDRLTGWAWLGMLGLLFPFIPGMLLLSGGSRWLFLIPTGLTGLLIWGLAAWGHTMNRRHQALIEVTLSRELFQQVSAHDPDYVRLCMTSAVPLLMHGDWDVLMARHELIKGMNDPINPNWVA